MARGEDPLVRGAREEATRREQTREFSARLLSETSKMLALINGGGIVVLIAWAQAAFSVPWYSVTAGFRIPLIIAIFLLLLGLTGAVLVPYFRHRLEEVHQFIDAGRGVPPSTTLERVIGRALFVRNVNENTRGLYWRGLWSAFWLSFLGFVAAAVVMLIALVIAVVAS